MFYILVICLFNPWTIQLYLSYWNLGAATSGVTDCQQAFIGGIAYGGYARKVCSWYYIYSVFYWNDTKVFSKYLLE